MIKPDYPSVLLIYTGGTIGMIEIRKLERWKLLTSTNFKKMFRN